METNLRMSNAFRVFATVAAIVTGSPQRSVGAEIPGPPRERILLNADWRFQKGDPAGVDSKNLLYDVRPVARTLPLQRRRRNGPASESRRCLVPPEARHQDRRRRQVHLPGR